jgi:hypothetical protein
MGDDEGVLHGLWGAVTEPRRLIETPLMASTAAGTAEDAGGLG